MINNGPFECDFDEDKYVCDLRVESIRNALARELNNYKKCMGVCLLQDKTPEQVREWLFSGSVAPDDFEMMF